MRADKTINEGVERERAQGSRRDPKDLEEGGGAGTFISPEEIMSREVELGCESWTSFASSCSSTAVQRTLSLWLCPSTAVETAIALVAGQWRGDTALTLPLFWRRSSLSGLFRAVSAVEPSLFRPPSPISHLASVDVKQGVLESERESNRIHPVNRTRSPQDN